MMTTADDAGREQAMIITRDDFIAHAFAHATTCVSLVEHHVRGSVVLEGGHEPDWGELCRFFALFHGGCVCLREMEEATVVAWQKASGLTPAGFNRHLPVFMDSKTPRWELMRWDSGLDTERVWDAWTRGFEVASSRPDPVLLHQALTQVCQAYSPSILGGR